jgi:hypothetical protein
MGKESNTINFLQLVGRHAGRSLTDKYLPTESEGLHGGFRRARELVDDDYHLLVMTTHPSETDEPRQYAELWKYPEFLTRLIHVPCASDQDTPVVGLAAKATGVKLYDVVTQDVIDRLGNVDRKGNKLPKGHGNIGYFRGIKRTASQEYDPAIIFLAPDAGRRPTLSTPTNRSAEFLMSAMGESRFAVLFVGVEIEGVADYQSAGGKNKGIQYKMRWGNCFKNSEVAREIERFRKENDMYLPVRAVKLHAEEKYSVHDRTDRAYYGAEQWMYATQFPDLVPESYKTPQVVFEK